MMGVVSTERYLEQVPQLSCLYVRGNAAATDMAMEQLVD